MKNLLSTNKNPISYPFQACVPEIRFLTKEEQVRLHHVSYSYRYGCFVRLALYTGIRLGELLALRWEDVDICSGLLYIRRSMYRRLKSEQPANSERNETETVIQAPKCHNSIRSIPLLPAVMQDLMKWREVQWNDRIEAGTSYQDTGFIVTDPQGNCLNPYVFFEQCMQMKKSADIEYFSPHTLRTTFAVRAVEQGVNPQALSQIMGYSTINSHPYLSGGCETGYLAPIGGLFAMGEKYDPEMGFPIVLTPMENGYYKFHSPDFPEIPDFAGPDISQGLLYMKESIEDDMLISSHLQKATPAGYYSQAPGELWLQIVL